MSDHIPLAICTVNKKGQVVCPTCKTGFVVPIDKTLSRGEAFCHACNTPFYVDDVAVEAFNHFLSKMGSDHSKQLLKDHEEIPRELRDDMRKGGIIER